MLSFIKKLLHKLFKKKEAPVIVYGHPEVLLGDAPPNVRQ